MTAADAERFLRDACAPAPGAAADVLALRDVVSAWGGREVRVSDLVVALREAGADVEAAAGGLWVHGIRIRDVALSYVRAETAPA